MQQGEEAAEPGRNQAQAGGSCACTGYSDQVGNDINMAMWQAVPVSKLTRDTWPSDRLVMAIAAIAAAPAAVATSPHSTADAATRGWLAAANRASVTLGIGAGVPPHCACRWAGEQEGTV